MTERVVEWKPRPRDRVFIRLSGGRFFTIPQEQAPSVEKGAIVSGEEIERLTRIDQYFRGKEKALHLLSIRSRTQHEIRKALDGLELLPAIRDGVLGELRETGLIDDHRFARDYVQNRVEFKQLGPHRLKFEMQRLGVAKVIIEEALSEGVNTSSQESAARDVIQKKLGDRTPTQADIRRLSGLLQRKGIDFEVINHVMYDLLQRVRTEEVD